ncbi:hypothetical protein AB0M50_44840 [Nonomuraea fuscirosea]|uniref:hypothetical protein n=1 Tax=Nonomuraea fuscirosea TaxID=1291556 RepID=UPI003440E5D8
MEKLVAGQRVSVGVIDGAQHRSPYAAFMHRTRIPQAAVRKPFTTTADGESAKTITHDEARLDIGSAALDEPAEVRHHTAHPGASAGAGRPVTH